MSKAKTNKIEPFKVICVDSSNKPQDVETKEWLKEGEECIVTGVCGDILSNNHTFIILGKNPAPFGGYRSNRFITKKGEYMPNVLSIN